MVERSMEDVIKDYVEQFGPDHFLDAVHDAFHFKAENIRLTGQGGCDELANLWNTVAYAIGDLALFAHKRKGLTKI